MRQTISLLAVTTLGLIAASCTADPAPSARAHHPSVAVSPAAVTPSAANRSETTLNSIESAATTNPRIPLLDREAPTQFATATFALG